MARASALSATHVRDVAGALSAAIAGPSGLGSDGLVDALRALEELSCVLTAAQAALAVELDAAERERQLGLGEPASRAGRGVPSLVAYARRESPHRGSRHLGLAKVVTREMPHTWAAWRDGHINEWTATVLARETACLDLPERRAVDRAIAADADKLAAMSPRQVQSAALAEAARLDPVALLKRRRKAESERYVSLRPAPDAMTYLTALLPMKAGVGVYAVLTRAAETARAAGDPRSLGQVMADTLTESVIKRAAEDRAAQTTWDRPYPPTEASASADSQGHSRAQGPASAVGVQLNLVVSDEVLLGGSDAPAWVEGFGPISGEQARELVADHLAAHERLALRRLYAAPATGQLVAMDARTRFFPTGLARFLVLRDQICRTPWCDAPIRQLDHAQGHAAGGATSAANGQGLCEFCNHAKQAPGWRAGPDPGGEAGAITTVFPTGHTATTRPPPVAAPSPLVDPVMRDATPPDPLDPPGPPDLPESIDAVLAYYGLELRRMSFREGFGPAA
ncbi:MAG: DUF222 domain-containing protein [Nocardioides sp.]